MNKTQTVKISIVSLTVISCIAFSYPQQLLLPTQYHSPELSSIDAVKSPNSRYQEILLDRLPQPVGGYDQLREKIEYPKIAVESGIQGKVLIWVFIDKNGHPVKFRIVEGEENGIFSQPAVAALKNTIWTPAVREGRPVGVGIYIPITFAE